MWVQGCTLACPGCYNPGLFDPQGGHWMEAADLAAQVNAAPGIRGLTLLGGEPLQQPQALLEFLRLASPELDRVLYTGFSWAEIHADPAKAAVLKEVDFVAAGRYLRSRASEANAWLGSDNKTLHELTGRIRIAEAPEARVEAYIRPDGSGLMTGFPPEDLKRWLEGKAA